MVRASYVAVNELLRMMCNSTNHATLTAQIAAANEVNLSRRFTHSLYCNRPLREDYLGEMLLLCPS